MALINLTSTTLSGFLEADFDEIKAALQSGTVTINPLSIQIAGTAITSTATELNVLDGIPGTLTATELGYCDGVTSAIQTQLDAKAPIADPTFTGEIGIGAVNVSETELGILEGATVTTAELNTLDGFTGVVADFNIIAGGDAAGVSATEFQYLNGVTSAIQTQIDTKAPIADPTFTGEIGIGAVNVSETELGILEGATLTTTELNYVDGVTSAIQTQLDAKGTMSDLVDDTTPQLGGDLDMNNKSLTREETAGELLADGDLCYLKSDGKYWKADASAEATASTDLLMATEAISADAAGTFLEYGELTSSGLTAGSNYFVSETAGEWTTTAPSTSTSIVRIVGTALSTTVLKFKPDVTFIEVA